MAVPNLDAAEQDLGEKHADTVARHREQRRQMTYRLAVLGTSVADVVRYVGGWLFDRAMAGWDVTVLVYDHHDDRPLRILGAATLDLESALAATAHGPWPHTLAVAADLYRHDRRVRDGVLETMDRSRTEVAMWGDNWPTELNGRACRTDHDLSGAAQAFKAHALDAAGVGFDNIEASETLRVGGVLGWQPGSRNATTVGEAVSVVNAPYLRNLDRI